MGGGGGAGVGGAEGEAEEAEENREVVAVQGAIEMAHKRIEVTSATPEDPALTAQLDVFLEAMDKECDTVLANFTHDLDSTFPTLRTMESNAANFVCDAVRDQTGADIVLINGGTLRSDMVHKAGPFRLRDLLRMLPFPDEVCIIQMTGAQVLDALRNGASSYPRLEGKFLQVSGLTYRVDPSEDIDPKQRVALKDVATTDGAPLDPTAVFKVCLPEYLQVRSDGVCIRTTAVSCLQPPNPNPTSPPPPARPRNLEMLQPLNPIPTPTSTSARSLARRASTSSRSRRCW